MQLDALIDDPAARIDAIAALLDQLDAPARWEEVGGLSRARQRMLYEKAAESAPIDLEQLVGGAPPLTEVIHDGLNTLPLPPPLRRFQKRFSRPDDGSD